MTAAHPLSLLTPDEVTIAKAVLDATGEVPDGASIVHILLDEPTKDELAAWSPGDPVHRKVEALVVPGSQAVSRAAEAKGLPEVFTKAGFEWRGAGCSMCLAMNPDKLEGSQICASSSNRNFKGRQGSPTGRTLLMSPAMVAAAAVAGEVVDVREVMQEALA